MPRFPEVRGVGMPRPGHQNIAISLQIGQVRSIVKPQAVHVLEVKTQAAFRSVHLESISVWPSDSETARFKAAQTAIHKTRHDHDCVIHITSGDERMFHCRE